MCVVEKLSYTNMFMGSFVFQVVHKTSLALEYFDFQELRVDLVIIPNPGYFFYMLQNLETLVSSIFLSNQQPRLMGAVWLAWKIFGSISFMRIYSIQQRCDIVRSDLVS